jgi:hypothetical protein
MTLTMLTEFSDELNTIKDDSNLVKLIILRFICTIALHMQIEGEIYQAIQMIKFSYHRINICRMRFFLIIIALMQLCGAIFTEAISILLICNSTTIKDIVMNFV